MKRISDINSEQENDIQIQITFRACMHKFKQVHIKISIKSSKKVE